MTFLIACETVLIVAVVLLAAWIRLRGEVWTLAFEEQGLAKAVLIAFVCQLSLYYADLYDMRVVADHRELFVRALAVTWREPH